MEKTGRITWAPGGDVGALALYADVGGHPLGAQFDAQGNLYVCDIGKVNIIFVCGYTYNPPFPYCLYHVFCSLKHKVALRRVC